VIKELNGIGLDVPDARRYLEVLSQAVQNIPFYPTALRRTVLDALDHAPPTETWTRQDTMRVLGFVDHGLIETLDREWHDYDRNEADRLFEYASSHRLFDSIKSAAVLGAGSCRLGDYLASLPLMDRVVCSDISWPALHFGRALIEANYAELPEILTKPRVFYHVEPQSTRLSRTTKESRFKPPLTPSERRKCIRYVVRDVFAGWVEPVLSELIVVPYLLDIFRATRAISLLLRICQRVRAGQQIVIIATCISEARAGPGRDPGLILDILDRCGFKVRFLDLTFLPYSFSYYSYGEVHTQWNTLVVRAERSADPGADIFIARSDRWHELEANRREKANPAGSVALDLVLGNLPRTESYRAFGARLIPQIGATEFENAIGELLAEGLVELRIGAS